MFRVEYWKRERRKGWEKINEQNRQAPHRRMEGDREGVMRKQNLLAQNITVLQGFGKQPPFSIFSRRAGATSTKHTKTSNPTTGSVRNPSSVGAAALSPDLCQPG